MKKLNNRESMGEIMGENNRCEIDEVITELGIDYQSAAELYSSYIEEMGEQNKLALQLLHEKEWGKLERVIHNIKGVSANLKINDVYKKAAEFDILLKKGDILSSEIDMKCIIMLTEQAENIIRCYFKSKGIIVK